MGFGGRLGSSLDGSGVGFEGSWGAFGAIPKIYKNHWFFQWFLRFLGVPKESWEGLGGVLGVVLRVVAFSLAILGGSCGIWVGLGWGPGVAGGDRGGIEEGSRRIGEERGGSGRGMGGPGEGLG